MREDAFRAYLAPLLSSRSVNSYLSYARRVQRELGVDLDAAGLLVGDTTDRVADGLRRAGYPERSVAASLVALSRYVEIQRGHGRRFPERLPALPPPARERHAAVAKASVAELMRLYGDLIAELTDRGVSRTGNGPVGDYAEHLFAAAYGWQLAVNSESGFDASDGAGRRYQIKARRLATPATARQLGAIRRLPERPFDMLAAVLFDDAMGVRRAALIPHPVVAERAVFVAHTNSWRLTLPDATWRLPGVINALAALRRYGELDRLP